MLCRFGRQTVETETIYCLKYVLDSIKSSNFLTFPGRSMRIRIPAVSLRNSHHRYTRPPLGPDLEGVSSNEAFRNMCCSMRCVRAAGSGLTSKVAIAPFYSLAVETSINIASAIAHSCPSSSRMAALIQVFLPSFFVNSAMPITTPGVRTGAL